MKRTARIKSRAARRGAWPQGGSAFIYVLDAADKRRDCRKLKERFSQLEGVAAVVGPDGYAKLGLPQPEANGESPDLVLLTNPGYSFAEQVTGEAVASAGGLKGTHGHDPRRATCTRRSSRSARALSRACSSA